MPLVIAQGHDWHLLLISYQPPPGGGRTVIWQKIDIGNTRNCFDADTIIAVLHLVMQWAETTWRPWFHSLSDLAKNVIRLQLVSRALRRSALLGPQG